MSRPARRLETNSLISGTLPLVLRTVVPGPLRKGAISQQSSPDGGFVTRVDFGKKLKNWASENHRNALKSKFTTETIASPSRLVAATHGNN